MLADALEIEVNDIRVAALYSFMSPAGDPSNSLGAVSGLRGLLGEPLIGSPSPSNRWLSSLGNACWSDDPSMRSMRLCEPKCRCLRLGHDRRPGFRSGRTVKRILSDRRPPARRTACQHEARPALTVTSRRVSLRRYVQQ
jgi:hypothetical protein